MTANVMFSGLILEQKKKTPGKIYENLSMDFGYY